MLRTPRIILHRRQEAIFRRCLRQWARILLSEVARGIAPAGRLCLANDPRDQMAAAVLRYSVLQLAGSAKVGVKKSPAEPACGHAQGGQGRSRAKKNVAKTKKQNAIAIAAHVARFYWP